MWKNIKTMVYFPFGFLKSIESINTPDRRWGLFQILPSIVFAIIGIAISILAIDIYGVGGGMVIIAYILFAIAVLILIGSICLALRWYYKDNKYGIQQIKTDEDTLHSDIQSLIKQMTIRNEKDDILHDDIQSLIRKMDKENEK